MAVVIAIANNKGGVGKSVTAVNLSAIWADNKLEVALIDNDNQGNCAEYLGLNINEQQKTMLDVYLGKCSIKNIRTKLDMDPFLKKHKVTFKHEHLDFFPAHDNLDMVNHKLGNDDNLKLLETKIAEIQDTYDIIVIDNSPDVDFLTKASLVAADLVLIPTEATNVSIKGLGRLLDEINKLDRLFKKETEVKAFVNNFMEHEKSQKDNLEQLVELFGDNLLDAAVPHNIHLLRAGEEGVPVFLNERIKKTSSPGAAAFRKIADDILQLFKEEEQ